MELTIEEVVRRVSDNLSRGHSAMKGIQRWEDGEWIYNDEIEIDHYSRYSATPDTFHFEYGCDIPMPYLSMDELIEADLDTAFLVSFASYHGVEHVAWKNVDCTIINNMIENGMLHKTAEAAIAHSEILVRSTVEAINA